MGGLGKHLSMRKRYGCCQVVVASTHQICGFLLIFWFLFARLPAIVFAQKKLTFGENRGRGIFSPSSFTSNINNTHDKKKKNISNNNCFVCPKWRLQYTIIWKITCIFSVYWLLLLWYFCGFFFSLVPARARHHIITYVFMCKEMVLPWYTNDMG